MPIENEMIYRSIEVEVCMLWIWISVQLARVCLRVNVCSCGFSFTFESCVIELIELSDLPCDGQIFRIILSCSPSGVNRGGGGYGDVFIQIYVDSLCLPAANAIHIDSKFSLALQLNFMRMQIELSIWN